MEFGVQFRKPLLSRSRVLSAHRKVQRASASAEGALAKAQESSTASQEAEKTLFRIGIGAGVAGVAAVAALWYNSSQLATQVNESVVRLRESYNELKEETERGRASLAQEIEALGRNSDDLQRSLGSALPVPIQNQLDDLRAQLERLQNRIDNRSSSE